MITIFPPWLFALPQTPAFGVCQRQGLQSHADVCSDGLSLLFSSPLPITDVWLHTCAMKVASSPDAAQFSACYSHSRAGACHRATQCRKETTSSVSVALPSTREISGDGSIPSRRGAVERLPSAANHKGLIRWRPSLTDTWIMCIKPGELFLPPLALMCRAEEIHSGYTHVPKPQTGCFGERSVLITTRSLFAGSLWSVFPM